MKKGQTCDQVYQWINNAKQSSPDSFLKGSENTAIAKWCKTIDGQTELDILNQWNAEMHRCDGPDDFTWSRHYNNRTVILIHDRADALLLLLYFVQHAYFENLSALRRDFHQLTTVPRSNLELDAFFEQFKFVSKQTKISY